jgi:hypothetical protein
MKEIAFFGGLSILLILTIYNRKQQEKALALLSNEERGRFVSHFSKLRIINLYTLIGMFVVYFIVLYAIKWNVNPGFFYFILIFLYMSINEILARKKMNEIELPLEYIKIHQKTTYLRWLGMLAMFAGLIYYLYG